MKLTGWLLGAAVAVALAGCSSEPTTAPTQPSAAVPPRAALSDAQFLDLARGIDYFQGGSDAGIIAAGKSLCGIFRPSTQGEPMALWKAAIDTTVSAGIPAKDAGSFLVYSVSAYCPQEYAYLPGV